MRRVDMNDGVSLSQKSRDDRRRPGYLPACRWPAREKRRAAWRAWV